MLSMRGFEMDNDEYDDMSKELNDRNVTLDLEQRPHAEDDLSVAAASILARATFIEAIQDYSKKSGIDIPLGSSSPEVKKVAKEIFKRWGKKGLERIAKMHFKTAGQIISKIEK